MMRVSGPLTSPPSTLVPRGGIGPPTRDFESLKAPRRTLASLWGRPSAPRKARQARYAEARSCTVRPVLDGEPGHAAELLSVVGDERQLPRDGLRRDQRVERADGLARSFASGPNLRVGRGFGRDEIENRQRREGSRRRARGEEPPQRDRAEHAQARCRRATARAPCRERCETESDES